MIIIARKGNIHKVMQFLEAEMVSGHMFIWCILNISADKGIYRIVRFLASDVDNSLKSI